MRTREKRKETERMIEFMESMAALCVYIARNYSTGGGHEAAKPKITLSKW